MSDTSLTNSASTTSSVSTPTSSTSNSLSNNSQNTASSSSSNNSNKTYLQRWLDFNANALKPPSDVLSTSPSETLDSPLLRGPATEPMSRPTLGPRSAHSSPSLGSATVKPIPIATAMKRSPSGGPRKSVSFAVDDNDRPIPIPIPNESGSNISTSTHSSRHSSLPSQLHSHHLPYHTRPKDFTLYPSPSPSPPTSPMFRSSSAPGATLTAADINHARMLQRQKELEDEIADLTRRQMAREAASREQLLRRVAEREAIIRHQEDSIAYQEAMARESFHRKFRGSASVSSSNGSPRLSASMSPKNSNERLVLFPSPLPSPSLSNHSPHPSPRHVHTHGHPSPKNISPHPSPLMETFRPGLPPVDDAAKRKSRSRSRSVEPEHHHHHHRARSPSPADSILAVVGEREDEVMVDAAAATTTTTPKKAKRSSRTQCERCGLFGHALTECMTPALKLPMRRKREPETPTKEEGQPPMKGLRHVKWLNVNASVNANVNVSRQQI